METNDEKQKSLSRVEKRQVQEKQLVVEQLRKTPIVQVSCEKTGIGRASYYRWRKEDPEFAKKANQALAEGVALVNDMAESQLLASIRDQNLTAIIFWLKHRHSSYSTKIELKSQHEDEKLSAEQKIIIQQALQIIGNPTISIQGTTDIGTSDSPQTTQEDSSLLTVEKRKENI